MAPRDRSPGRPCHRHSYGAINALGHRDPSSRRTYLCSLKNAPQSPPVYIRPSSRHLRIAKKVGHGSPTHRPQSAGYDPGTTPPRARSAPSGLAQKRDNETHRPVKSRLRHDVTDRGPHQPCGAGEKPAGKRLASVKRHRADTDQEAKGLPPHDGGKERGPEFAHRREIARPLREAIVYDVGIDASDLNNIEDQAD